MDRLREALDLYDSAELSWKGTQYESIIAAARLVVEGERLLWCVPHKRPSPNSTSYCHIRWWEWRHDPCQVVGRLLTERPR